MAVDRENPEAAVEADEQIDVEARVLEGGRTEVSGLRHVRRLIDELEPVDVLHLGEIEVEAVDAERGGEQQDEREDDRRDRPVRAVAVG